MMTHQQSDDLVRTKTLVEDMHHRLFGNGQPGIIATMDSRVEKLETVKHKGQGVLWTLTVIVAIVEFIQVVLGLKKV